MRLIMTQTQPVALIQDWQLWDGRIVDGKYPLQEFLGESERIAAYLTEINGVAAVIKLLAADEPHAPAQMSSWNLAARLSHPNLVQVFDTGLWHADDEHDVHFAVIEYCEESLAAVLRQRSLSPDDARQMLLPALDALNYLHHQGLLHGRLSPASILANDDQLKLATDHLRRSTDITANPVISPYDAPEKATGTISLTSDIWALGMTLHESLTRRLPTRNKDGTTDITEKLPGPFDEIVKQCLTSDRERRPSLAAIRSLLERPAPVLVSNRNGTGPDDLLPLPDMAMLRPKAAASMPASERLEEGDGSWRGILLKRPVVAAVIVLIVFLAVFIGVRRSKENQVVSSSSDIARESAPTASAARQPATAHPLPSQNSTAAAGSVLHQAVPEIPERVRNTINGAVKVRVRVSVTAEGKVARAELSARGPSAYFARQALEAARQWSFAPPVHNGKAQASDWMLHFEFRRSGTRVAAQRA